MTATLTRTVQVDGRRFADAVAWAAARIQSHPTTPTLGGLLFDATDGRLSVSGFDYESAGAAHVDAEGVDGRWLVSGRLLHALVSTFPDKPVTLAEADNRLAVTCGGSKFGLPLMDPADYPTLPDMPPAFATVSGEAFAHALKRVAFAAGTEAGKPALTGVFLRFTGDRLTLIASDSYRVGIDEIPADGGDGELLVPAGVLRSATGQMAGDLSLARSEHLFGLDGPSGGLTVGLIPPPAKFPADGFLQLVARPVDSPARVPVAELVTAVKRGRLVIAEKTDPVKLRFGHDSLSVLSGSESTGDDEVECAYTGVAWTYAFNPGYLLDAIGAVGSAEVDLLFTPGKLAVVFAPVDGSDPYRHIVMSIRAPGGGTW